MPSHAPLHTVRQFVQAFHQGVQGARIATEDNHTGSSYDLIAGPSAIFFKRLETRDRDLFASLYDETATGQDLSNRLFALTGIARILDSYGTGTVTLVRPTTAAGAGTFWPGTRVLAQGSASGSGYYAINGAFSVTATQTQVSLPIRATVYGPGVAIDSTTGAASGVLADALWDNTWTVRAINCVDGTLFEKSKDYLARVRLTQIDDRVGFQTDIIQACQSVGAGAVAVFNSNYANNDYGISAVYVGDSSFNGSTSLVNACILTLEGVRILGADLMVAPMVSQTLTVLATVTLTQDPSLIDTASLGILLKNAVASQFATVTNGFSYSKVALFGAMQQVTNLVQSATWTNVLTGNPLADATVMTGSPPVFPATLTRYSLPVGNVQVAFLAPA